LRRILDEANDKTSRALKISLTLRALTTAAGTAMASTDAP
jgi:hypothetical protein